MLHSLIIELHFLVFALCLLMGCYIFFRKFIEIDRFALRAAICLGFVSNLLSLPPPPPPADINPTCYKPRLDLENALLLSANQIQ